ncbi:MAG: hypothetical protein M1829_000324 [Trizodia sp. TS-e1964]|nr:MAG: hypothetical protein M1829_000324 [Trizodia sp. TS-e1964]
MASSTASLEGLPQEITEKIFIYSINPNLPLVSRHLLAQLSSPRLKMPIATRMLRSKDPGIQSDLLGRRFLDLKLFDAATREITEPCYHSLMGPCGRGFQYYYADNRNDDEGDEDGHHDDRYFAGQVEDLYGRMPHFAFSSTVTISPRLLHNFEDPPTCWSSRSDCRFWKIELIWRLMAAKIRTRYGHPAESLTSPAAKAAAQQGLLEAIRAHNYDAVRLLTMPFVQDSWPFVHADWQSFRYAVVDVDCPNTSIVYHLSLFRLRNQESDPQGVKLFREWVKRRQLEDSQLRAAREVYSYEVKSEAWVGDWLSEMVNCNHPAISYWQFATNRLEELEEEC